MTNQPTTTLVNTTKAFPSHPTEFSEASLDPDGNAVTRSSFQCLTDSALKTGLHAVADPGTGKSRWLARVLAWRKFLQHEPLVLIDPTGAVIDNLFDKIGRLPWDVQPELWQRIFYIDVGSQEYAVPTPLYYSQSKADTLFEIANRLPSVFERQDPALAGAPILGLNALRECAIYAGQIAAALNRQLDFVIDLIDHPHVYKAQLREALAENPELQPAVTYFRELMDPGSGKLREKRTGSFKNKLLPFNTDSAMLATFAGTQKRLNWTKAINKRKTVLIDLRNERDPDRRQFKMIWYLKTFMDYIKNRGMAGRGQEVMLIIDEITDMLDQRTKEGHSILAADMEELITRLGRNFGVNVIVAHQNLSQLDERIQNVFMQMGTQIVGRLSNPNDAVRVARQFLRYDPYKIKKTERVWHSLTEPRLLQLLNGHYGPVPVVVDHRSIEFTPDEQLLDIVNRLQSLGRFRFMTQLASGEGDRRSPVTTISIERLDQNHYPNEQILAPLRRQLAQRDGVPVETLLAEIRANRTREAGQKPKKQPEQSATMDVSPIPQPSEHHVTTDHLSVTTEPAEPVPAIRTPADPSEGTEDEPVFQ